MKQLSKLNSRAQMKAFARKIAKEVLVPTGSRNPDTRPGPKKHATVIGLVGELGAGKTTFTQEFLRDLGVKGPIISPTFLLMRRYAIRHTQYANAYHIDCYRLDNPRELLKLGLKEILKDPANLVFIEWADRMKNLLPKSTRWITIEHGNKKTERYVSHQY